MPQSLSKIYVHLIFSTKNRERDIFPQYQSEMFAYIAGTLNNLGCLTVIVGGDADHIHALFAMSRTKTISEVVRDVKTSATIWYKSKLNCNFRWQEGYGVFSVSYSNLEIVRQYITNQHEHHRHQTFQEEYMRFLNEYHVPYDERYVWD